LAKASSDTPLYGPEQSAFARYLERREQRKPDPVARERRRRLLAGLSGRVIEVGCGDGRAFELYPATVTGVLAVEPDPIAREAAAERARSASVPIEVVDGTAESLPAEDGSMDAAVLVWVLCSVSDPAAALAEVRRVVRPGGELRFYEHVRSRNPLFRAAQHAVDRVFWTRALGGCRTTRDTESAIRGAGFEVSELDRGFHSSSVLTITSAPYVVGVARR
jgi:ubiquinone/menaquinone biosynthesis C-methylase UbiE